MSGDDWQAGDLALCRYNGPIPEINSGPRAQIRPGMIYLVDGVGMDGWNTSIPCLFLRGVMSAAPDGGFAEVRFSKIRPHTPDAEDAETIRLLNSAPVKEPVA